MLSVYDVVQRASDTAFGKPLVMNVHRSLLVEAIVDAALPTGWVWCSSDYASCDFVHEGGTRLEVKQSAARQSWASTSIRKRRSVFDIAPRTGYWEEGSNWVPKAGRNADMYVLAYHPVEDDSADHRDPTQWLFYVVATAGLPQQNTISLSRVERLAGACRHEGLGDEIERLRTSVQPLSESGGFVPIQKG